mgnify:CR=1 FL=1
MMKEIEITKINFLTRKVELKTDLVAEERPLHIFVNNEHYVTILCSPDQLKELAVGHLLSEGVLKSLDEIKDVRLDDDGKFHFKLRDDIDFGKRILASNPFSRIILSSCGSSSNYWPITSIIDRIYLPRNQDNATVDSRIILESIRHLNEVAKLFRSTGGVHVAALYSFNGELLALAEDVGRHNAVDKIVGAAAGKGLSLDECFLTSSGRLSGDIVLKTARLRIPVVASMSAALSSGVDVAKLAGITLIAFVRGTRMNILTHPERIRV